LAASEPSSISADCDLLTVTLLNSSEAKVEKSKPRERLMPATTPRVEPVVAE